MSAAPEDPEWSVGSVLETSSQGTGNLVGYCTRLALERRGGSGGDILTMLANATVDGTLLPDEHLGFNGLMFFAAGHETTRASLSAGFLELLRNRDQLRKLKEDIHDPAVVERAVEESVRWSSPLTHTLRTATRDLEISGAQIREGDWVVPWFISANHDEQAFEGPERFDAGRMRNDHLGFAKGKHHCLGVHLAKAEMRIMLELLITELGDAELTAEPEMAASNLFWGLKHMPVRFPRSSRKERAA
jgi:cytochrome P450